MADGRAAWVTGAGGDLGSAVVTRLADDGWVGVASGHAAAPCLPGGWRGHTGDLATAKAAEAAARLALDAFGRLNLAVLPVGGWEGGAPAVEADEAALDRMWQANVVTAWQCARAAARVMAAGDRPGGRAIVLVSAFTALASPAPAGQAAYRASKAAVASLAESLASELASRGVAVFALAPTTLRTPANRRSMPGADASHWVDLGDVSEIVRFLATPAARAMSGAVLPLDARVRS